MYTFMHALCVCIPWTILLNVSDARGCLGAYCPSLDGGAMRRCVASEPRCFSLFRLGITDCIASGARRAAAGSAQFPASQRADSDDRPLDAGCFESLAARVSPTVSPSPPLPLARPLGRVHNAAFLAYRALWSAAAAAVGPACGDRPRERGPRRRPAMLLR